MERNTEDAVTIIKFYNSGLKNDEIKLQSLILDLIHLLTKNSTRQKIAKKLFTRIFGMLKKPHK